MNSAMIQGTSIEIQKKRNSVKILVILEISLKTDHISIDNLVLPTVLLMMTPSRRANARNVSSKTLYGGQFTLSAQSIKPNYPELNKTTLRLDQVYRIQLIY